MTMPDDTATQVLRPSRAARRRLALYSLIPVLLLTLVMFINFSLGPWRFIVLGPLIVLFLVYFVFALVITRLEFAGGSYLYATALFRRRFTVGEIERVIAVDEIFYGLNGAKFLFVVGAERRRLFRMNSIAWDTAQLEAVANELVGRGVPLTHLPGQVTPGEFDRREPGILYWHEAHRGAFLAIVLGGTLVLAIAAIAITAVVLTSMYL
jgi:hypothetical protein